MTILPSTTWNADYLISLDDAQRLIEEQCPTLTLSSIQVYGEGWDNVAYLVNDQLVFRFPRRAIAVKGVQREIAAIPLLSSLLSVPIPTPLYSGIMENEDRWPFFGYKRIEGVELCDCALGDEERGALAQPLALFLKELHSSATKEKLQSIDAKDPLERSDLTKRRKQAFDYMDQIQHLLPQEIVEKLRQILRESETLSVDLTSVIVHGDLHFRHLILSNDKTLTGVIDWGDMCLADPVIDLHVYWSLFPTEYRATFLTNYGEVSPERLQHARIIAIFLNAVLLDYASQTNREMVVAEAIRALTLVTS